MKNALIALLGSTMLAAPAFAQDVEAGAESPASQATYGGQSGPDMSLEAMTPEDEAVNVGLSGQDPSFFRR